MSAIVNGQPAVHYDVRDALGQLLRIVVGCGVADGLRVEADQIGGHPGADEPTVREPEPLRREGRHLPDRVLPREDSELAHVDAEVAGKRAPATGMRTLTDEDPSLPGM